MYFRLLINFSFFLVLIVCECALFHKLDAPTSERLTEVDVSADLSRSTHCSCLAELAQGQTFGPWESN